MKKFGISELISLVEESYVKDDDICLIGESHQPEVSILNDDFDNIERFNNYINEIFSFVKKTSKPMIVRKHGTIVFLLSPLNYENDDHLYTPMYNLGIEAFAKSLAKELNPFNVKIICIVLPLSDQPKRQKGLDLVSLKYRGISLADQARYIKVIIDNSEVFNGQTIGLGANLSFLK